MLQQQSLQEAPLFRHVLSEDRTTLVLLWKQATTMDIPVFRKVVEGFAQACRERRPTRAVIDARAVSPDTVALQWVRGQCVDDNGEHYAQWWPRVAIPVYNQAEIKSLAVATGNPQAPGETPAPEAADFRTGYFDDLEAALGWQP